MMTLYTLLQAFFGLFCTNKGGDVRNDTITPPSTTTIPTMNFEEAWAILNHRNTVHRINNETFQAAKVPSKTLGSLLKYTTAKLSEAFRKIVNALGVVLRLGRLDSEAFTPQANENEGSFHEVWGAASSQFNEAERIVLLGTDGVALDDDHVGFRRTWGAGWDQSEEANLVGWIGPDGVGHNQLW